MRKVDEGEKKKKEKEKIKEKIMSFLVATNVIASRPPERQPTGTPHACAKSIVSIKKLCARKELIQQIFVNVKKC